jgi:hypothetical protein
VDITSAALVAFLALLFAIYQLVRARGRVRVDVRYEPYELWVRVTVIGPSPITVDGISLFTTSGRLARLRQFRRSRNWAERRRTLSRFFSDGLFMHVLPHPHGTAHFGGPPFPREVKGYSGQSWSFYPLNRDELHSEESSGFIEYFHRLVGQHTGARARIVVHISGHPKRRIFTRWAPLRRTFESPWRGDPNWWGGPPWESWEKGPENDQS